MYRFDTVVFDFDTFCMILIRCVAFSITPFWVVCTILVYDFGTVCDFDTWLVVRVWCEEACLVVVYDYRTICSCGVCGACGASNLFFYFGVFFGLVVWVVCVVVFVLVIGLVILDLVIWRVWRDCVICGFGYGFRFRACGAVCVVRIIFGFLVVFLVLGMVFLVGCVFGFWFFGGARGN